MKKPQKPPIIPADPGLVAHPEITLSQERLIGRFVVEWAKLELSMDDLIWNFLDLPFEHGRIMTKNLDATSKITRLRDLNETIIDKSSTEYIVYCYLKEVLDIIDIIRESRNLIVHGTWGLSHPHRIPIALSLRTKDTPSTVVSETFPAERMRILIHEAVSLKWKLVSLFDVANAAHRRSRERFLQMTPNAQPNQSDQIH